MGKTVGERIEAMAASKGLPQGAALAALFGVQYETLRKWRTGEAAPNRSRQQAIAAVLGVAPAAFMHGVAEDAAKAATAEPWPFERITPQQWAKLTARQQGAIEDAAVQKLRDVALPDEGDAPLFARAGISSRKRQIAGR